MKVYIFRKCYSLCGLSGKTYSVCTHRSNCPDNRKFLEFEKRNDKWLLWDYVNDMPTTVENLDDIIKSIPERVAKLIKLKTGKIIDTNDFEIVGLSKIIDK